MREIEYTHGYYPQLAPLHATQALRMAGFSRPCGTGRRYLELGCGLGLAANIHAAATGLEIWGTDFTSSHAAHARELAAEAETGAILFDDSFAELLERRDLPQFDMIALHGIWSWVDDGARRTIIEIARRHLALGGYSMCPTTFFLAGRQSCRFAIS
jgi:SAM-dependent methyltransferase